jgi:hypothetical protein
VSGPNLALSDQDALYATALKSAIANADAKAKTIADAAGLQLGAVQTVVEGSAPAPIVFGAVAKAPGAPGSVSVEPGTQEVDATVTVTYAAG